MNRRWGGRGVSEQTLLVLMAVAAVLLAMSVVTSLSGGSGNADPDRPRASFVFETNGADVLVTHYGGDRLNGSHVSVESERRGPLGDFAGTDGEACATPVANVTRGASCLVPGAAYEQLYVVWNGSNGDRLILGRRPAAPTPSPTPTVTPTPTATPAPIETSTVTVTPTVGPNGTVVSPGDGTATPAPNGTSAPTSTATDGTETGETPADGTATTTLAGTAAGASTDTPTATPTGG